MVFHPYQEKNIEESTEKSDDEEWGQFRRDMFGSDFDMSDELQERRRKLIANGVDRDETMKVL